MGKLSKFFDKPEKWFQGDFSNEDEVNYNEEAKTLCYCLIGGYCHLKGVDPLDVDKNDNTIMDRKTPPTLVKIYNALPKKYQNENKEYGVTKQECIATFNDNPKTTFNKIKKVLEKAGV